MFEFGSLKIHGLANENIIDHLTPDKRKITLSAPADGGFCEITVRQHFAYPPAAYMLDVWTAGAGFPGNLTEVCQRRITYSDCCHGTVLPMLSLLDHDSRKGISIIVPPGSEPGGSFFFDLDDFWGEGITLCFQNIGLKPGSSTEIEIIRLEHTDCYRPALQWMLDHYPEYFLPEQPAVNQDRGAFVMTNPGSSDRLLAAAEKHHARWSEIHNHYPSYGNYAPEDRQWDSVITHDYPEQEKLLCSPEIINRHIDRLHQHHIAAMLYIQCGGDAFRPWIEKYYPEAIVRGKDGRTLPTWKECILAYDDGKSPYSRYLENMILRFLKNYPEIDGIFLDQLCYNTLDYAHHDGRCGADGKPAAMTGSGYAHGLKILAGKLHPAGKRIWGNGPFNLNAARHADGIMAEGLSGTALVFKYLALAKPMLVHAYTETADNAESIMQYCMLTGAGWSLGGSSKAADPGPWSPDTLEIFERYLPLVRPLITSRIVLTAHPVRLPHGFQGEVFFNSEENCYYITLIGASVRKTISLAVNLPSEGRPEYRSLHQLQWTTVENSSGTLVLPGNETAYLIRLPGKA